jgi:hypothetical protein
MALVPELFELSLSPREDENDSSKGDLCIQCKAKQAAGNCRT